MFKDFFEVKCLVVYTLNIFYFNIDVIRVENKS